MPHSTSLEIHEHEPRRPCSKINARKLLCILFKNAFSGITGQKVYGMQLCHTIRLMNNGALEHALCPYDGEAYAPYRVLLKPRKMSFCAYSFAAIMDDNLVFTNASLPTDLRVFLHLQITDEIESKSLLEGLSQSYALFMLGEIIDGIGESLETLGLRLVTLAPKTHSGMLAIEFIVPKSCETHAAIGSALCLNGALDSLVFSRGLKIARANVSFGSDTHILEPTFQNLFQGILGRE